MRESRYWDVQAIATGGRVERLAAATASAETKKSVGHVVVLISWWGGQPKQIARYSEAYRRNLPAVATVECCVATGDMAPLADADASEMLKVFRGASSFAGGGPAANLRTRRELPP